MRQTLNQLQLTANLAERDTLRYTPAGIPVMTAKLLHQSEQVEAAVNRQIEFEIAALAAGEIAGRFEQALLGQNFKFTGFIARKGRNSKSLVFHITDFEALTSDH